MELRSGEVCVQCAGGKCVVCKGRIEPGQAVQLSSRCNQIRHVDCTPATDNRRKRCGTHYAHHIF